jgi:hypothetical protein
LGEPFGKCEHFLQRLRRKCTFDFWQLGFPYETFKIAGAHAYCRVAEYRATAVNLMR